MINKKIFIFDTLAAALKFKVGADPRNTTYRQGSFAADATIVTGEPDIPYYSEILIRETNQIWRCNQFWMNDVERSPDNDLATEHAERVTADTKLQDNIDALSEALTEADAKSQANIDTLASEMHTADTQLQTNIDALSDILAAADAQLQTNIDTLASAVTASDTLIKESIDTLAKKNVTLEQSAQKETEERKAADEKLAQVLATQQAAITALGLKVDGMAEQLITIDEFRAISPKEFKTYFVARDEADKAKLKCWRIYLRSQLIGEFESDGTLTLPVFPMRFPFRMA